MVKRKARAALFHILAIEGIGDGTHEVKHAPSRLRIGNPVIGSYKLKGLAPVHRIVGDLISLRFLFLLEEAARGLLLNFLRHFFEKEINLHLKDPAQVKEPACANTVCATLIFLDLLECEPERLTQLLLV